MQIMAIPDLIVPRKAGFWRVGARTYCDPGGSEDLEGNKTPLPNDIWFARPVGERPTVDGLIPCPEKIPDTCERDDVELTFVNGEYISLGKTEESNCGALPGQFAVMAGSAARRFHGYAGDLQRH